MRSLTDVVQLKEGEQVEQVIRRHGLTLGVPLVLAAALIVFPFFFLFSLPQLGVGGIVLFVVLLVTGVTLALRAFVMWDADMLILTSHRLVRVDQRGIWHRIVTEVSLTSVHDVSVESQGFVDKVFQQGAVRIQSAGSPQGMLAPRLWRPHHVQQLVQGACARYTGSSSASSSLTTRRAHIQQLLDHVPEDTVQAIETILEGTESQEP